MDKLKELLNKAKESPKNAVETANKLLGKITDAEVSFDCPEKYASLFGKFADADEDTEIDVKSIPKISELKNAYKKKDTKTKKVRFSLKKFKSIFKKNSKKFVDDGEKMEESAEITLLEAGELETVAAASGIGVGFGVAFGIVYLGIACYILYVEYLMHKYEHTNIFAEDGEEPTTMQAIGSMAVKILLPFIYFIVIHIQIKKHYMKESADSVLDMFESEGDYDVARYGSGCSTTDSELIEAYRKVVEDLAHRVPSDNSAMI